MPPPPSRMNREEGEAGEIHDAPPPRREALSLQRYSSVASAGSYASLALDPPSHLQRTSSNATDDSRRGGGRSFVDRILDQVDQRFLLGHGTVSSLKVLHPNPPTLRRATVPDQ